MPKLKARALKLKYNRRQVKRDIILGIAYNDIDIELPDGVDITRSSSEWATNIMVRKA